MKSLRNAPLLTSALLLSAPLLGCWDAGAQYGGNWRTDFSKHVVPLEEIVSGGPSKDGIPATDDPKFISLREAKCCNAASSPISVRRKQHMYSIETPEPKPYLRPFGTP